MRQNSTLPTELATDIKAYCILEQELVQSSFDQENYPMVLMDADTPEDIYAVYGVSGSEWIKDGVWRIVSSKSLPAKVLRATNAVESRYILRNLAALDHINSEGLAIHFDATTQKPQVIFRNRKKLENLPTSVTVPHFGELAVRFELMQRLPSACHEI